MLSRDTIHSNSTGHLGFVPPIEFNRIGYSMILKQRSIAQPGDEAWVVLPLESEQRCDVQMIVVVVTQEHDIDWRKVFEAQAWSAMSPRTSRSEERRVGKECRS